MAKTATAPAESSTVLNISIENLPALLGLYEDRVEEKKEIESQLTDLHAAILAHPDVKAKFKEKGTATVNDRLKTVGKITEKWDQEKLKELETEVDAAYFPFNIEYKPDNKKMTAIKDMFPDLYTKLRTALSVKPAKTELKISPLEE